MDRKESRNGKMEQSSNQKFSNERDIFFFFFIMMETKSI